MQSVIKKYYLYSDIYRAWLSKVDLSQNCFVRIFSLPTKKFYYPKINNHNVVYTCLLPHCLMLTFTLLRHIFIYHWYIIPHTRTQQVQQFTIQVIANTQLSLTLYFFTDANILPKLPTQCYSNGPSNLSSLGGKKKMIASITIFVLLVVVLTSCKMDAKRKSPCMPKVKTLGLMVIQCCPRSVDFINSLSMVKKSTANRKYTQHLLCISLLLPRLPKLPSKCYSHGPGNLSNLSSNKEIQF